MANWTFTHVTVYSEDKEQLENLKTCFNIVEKEVKNNNSEGWIGEVLTEAHEDFKANDLSEVDSFLEEGTSKIKETEKDNKKIYYFYFSMQEKWYPHFDKPFSELIQKPEYDQLKIAYVTEDEDDEIYEKYDPDNLFYKEDQFFLDVYLEEELTEFDGLETRHLTLNELLNLFNANTLKQVKDVINELNQVLEENDEYVELIECKNLESLV